jgi:glycosyltransferase involved in cell wall biosynthesis
MSAESARAATGNMATVVGVVVIGRNEGDRLRRCLMSVLSESPNVVYVDSGSTDGSPALAASLGARVHHLDLSQPFTAARGRNEGLALLMRLWPALEYVQFVDGDCEVVTGWLQAAVSFLHANPAHAAVCGRRRERFPEHSVYNRLCDEEWNTPVGDTRSCGGDVMFRTPALLQAGGYRDGLIAGEEPELCLRLRQLGWRIHRLDQDMTWHDAAILRFSQWWRRSERAGHAFAEGAWLHGDTPEKHWVWETRRALAWGLVLPLGILIAALIKGSWALWLALLFPLQMLRMRGRGLSFTSAFFLVLGKFAETSGVMRFHVSRWRGRVGKLIEYK